MFAIGDQDWPGIAKLAEECGELVQVCGKLIATAGEHEHWDGTNLRDRLSEELGDVLAAATFVMLCSGLDKVAIHARMDAKLATFMRWQLQGPERR